MPFSWLWFGSVKASASARAEALASPGLEHFTTAQEAVTLIAGGKQTRGALPVCTDLYDAAVYSSRGRGYARYNEDAAGLFHDERGRMYAAVFDQAGGLGGTVRGAGSEVAARAALTSFRKIATGAEGTDVTLTMLEAIQRAHEALVSRQEGEVTTAVLAVATETSVQLVSSGDSAAMHFDAQGALRTSTTKHEVRAPSGASCLTHAVGLEPELPAADTYEWEIQRGDWLLLCSDGLLDSGVEPPVLGRMLVSAATAEDGVNAIASKVLRRMSMMRAKPDNLTIVGLHARA